jgi:hypothetical protein
MPSVDRALTLLAAFSACKPCSSQTDPAAAMCASAAFPVRQGDAWLCQYRVDSPQPVRDPTRAGELPGAVALTMPAPRPNAAQVPRVCRAARQISESAGGAYPLPAG